MRIEDYALIGDCETAALVGRNGSIDWLCWPRFDSDACFAALLGHPENGRWLIAPKAEIVKTERRYRGDTLILETIFETKDGRVRLTDFMPMRNGIEIVRFVEGLDGTVEMCCELILRFGYGAYVPWVTRESDGLLKAISGPDMVMLRADVPTKGKDMKTVAEFAVSAGESVSFVLSYAPSHLPPTEPIDAAKALKLTEKLWCEWVEQSPQKGEWADVVTRSLITLKALTYAPTGGIIAAPTTSLPETPGGIRNWDYRFCWLRDSTLTLMALMNAGFFSEAQAWRDWLLRAVAGNPAEAQIMYGLAGERRLTEWEIDWLDGYEGAKPVRVGNAAAGQLQLDVFGEVIDTFYQAFKGGIPIDEPSWSVLRALLKELETRWKLPDRGIWESRGEPRHHTYSKVMCWVAFDRAIKMAEEAGFDGPVDRWRETRSIIHDDICEKAFDGRVGSFTAWYGTDMLDASLLLLPNTGFLPPTDPRIHGTIEAIEQRMMPDGFVLRHDPRLTEGGLKHGEGAFLACSFWLADAYVLIGRREEAEKLLHRLIGLCNDVGLLAEEYSGALKRQLGNFPQAFSHVALINTIHNLVNTEKPAEQRSEHKSM